MTKMRFSSKMYLYAVYAFLYIPIFVLIVFSFNESKSRANWTGFTFDWYIKLFQNETIMTSLLNTVIVAVAASVFSTILGTMAAIGIHNMRKTSRTVLMNLTYMNPTCHSSSKSLLIRKHFLPLFIRFFLRQTIFKFRLCISEF